MSGFLSLKSLRKMGVRLHGNNIQVSKGVSFHNPENIKIGNNTRIDAGVVLSAHGPITIGKYVHLARNSLFYSGKHLNIGNFVTVSAGCNFYGASDRYDGTCLIGPTVPDEFRNVETGTIDLEDFSSISTSCIFLPNSFVPSGCVIGACSLVNGKKSMKEWTIYAGNPLREITSRKRDMIELAKMLD